MDISTTWVMIMQMISTSRWPALQLDLSRTWLKSSWRVKELRHFNNLSALPITIRSDTPID
jgi:hypothetical protein